MDDKQTSITIAHLEQFTVRKLHNLSQWLCSNKQMSCAPSGASTDLNISAGNSKDGRFIIRRVNLFCEVDFLTKENAML